MLRRSATVFQRALLSTNSNNTAPVIEFLKNSKGFSQIHYCRRAFSSHPVHYKILLPALSPTMEQGTIVKWEKSEGDFVAEGDLLAEIETDKATVPFETPEEGYLAKIILPEGSKDVALGKQVCIIVPEKNDIAAFAEYTPEEAPVEIKSSTKQEDSNKEILPKKSLDKPIVQNLPQHPNVKSPSNRIFASPFAKKIAREKNINLASVSGSGENGRIVAKDLDKIPESVPTQLSFTDLDLTNFRKVTAQRLLQSKQTIPHYYLTAEITMDRLLTTRTSINERQESGKKKISVNDFIIKAAALACEKVPEANSSWHDTFIRQYCNVDVSVAVNTDRGLITPIVFDAANKGLGQISTEMHELAVKARENRLQPSEFIGGTFTISNLGMMGVNHFSAIINPPQVCILAVGTTESKLVSSAQGATQSKRMSVTLSSDHRVVDGAIGAKWLSHFRNFMENPELMLL